MFYKYKLIKNFIIGGALISVLFITKASAYDQEFTHPALTDEIVDFYNLNFSQKLSNQDKVWLIKGSVDEDQGIRPMNHFYDPIHNIGMAGFLTSKQWAMSSGAQSNLAMANRSIAESAGLIKSADDFSYKRALDDYAQGDRQRTMIAFGHLLHLLEDAGVPDHTRNDPHPPVGTWGSPYEHEMAKWNPGNFNIATELKKEGLKPVILVNLDDYFDKIAKYSNGNFFSKDTIFSKDYPGPVLDFWEYKQIKDGHTYKLGYKKDFNGKYILVKEITEEGLGNQSKQILTIEDEDILDGYWDRLSKDVILNGAGALNLFLTEAEKAKTEYANRSPEKPNRFAKLLGLIGIDMSGLTTRRVVSPQGVDNSNDGDSMVTPSPKVTKQPVSPSPLVTKTPDTNVTILSPTLSPIVSPSPSPVSFPGQTEKVNINTANKELLMTLKNIKEAKSEAIIQHRQTDGPFQKIEDIMNVSGIGQATFDEVKDFITVGDIVPTPSPVFYASGGGGGSSSTPTPTPSPSVSPSPSPTPSPTPTPTPDPSSPLLQVVINEIAWMGTSASLSSDEWMELYNTTNTPVSIDGWILKSETDGSPNITLTGTIGAFGYYLIERTDDNTVSDIAADFKGSFGTGGLKNTGEKLVLKDGSSNVQDVVDGSSAWFNKGTASPDYKSMERVDPKKSGGDSTNWATNNGTIKNGHDAGGNPINGTPRARNSVYISLKPSAVKNLAVTGNFGQFSLTWSAPSDLDTLPINLVYDLHYSTKSFATIDDWNTSYKLASASLPSVAEGGAPASASFSIAPNYNQKWYFSLKTKDQTDASDISNIVDKTTESAISDSWSMLGKDQYHTSFATDIAGPGSGAAIIWEYDAESGNTTTGAPIANVFRSNQISTPCIHGGDYFKLYLAPGTATYGFWPCAGGVGTWGENFNTGFNNLTFTELEFHGNPACGTFEQCSASALSTTDVILRADGWTPTGSVNNAVVFADGDIYFGATDGSSHKLLKLNKNGVKQWEYASNVSIGAPAVLSDEAVYFGRIGAGGSNTFTALNQDQSKRWDYSGAGSVSKMTVSPDGSAYFTTNLNPNSRLQVLNSAGNLTTEKTGPGFYDFSPVVLENGAIVAAKYESGNQFFNAYSSDGNQLWNLSYTGVPGKTPSDPSYDKLTGKTYSAAGSKLFDIPLDGSVLNTHQIDPSGVAATMVAISSDTLYVGFNDINPASGSRLFAINKSDLTTKWSFSADSRVNNQTAIDKNDNIYFSTESGTLYSVNKDGSQNWKIGAGTASTISPVLTENGLIWGYGNRLVGVK